MNKKAFLSMIPIYTVVFAILFAVVVFGNQAVISISENAPVKSSTCVIIDAGHGGEDGGATSCTGILESKINLEIANRLEDLMHLLGIRTSMIRTSDISVYTEGKSLGEKKISDLRQRVKIVNETDNALLLSIHQNYFSDPKYSGAQVFYANTPNSRILANKMQTAFIHTLNHGSKRNIKAAEGIYLMDKINCTGVLIECGFLSNPTEEAKLRSKEYQLQLCCVMAASCSNYLYSQVA